MVTLQTDSLQSIAIAMIQRVLDVSVSAHVAGFESIAKCLGLKLESLPINLLKTANEANCNVVFQVCLH
jgi:hypothetical protein